MSKAKVVLCARINDGTRAFPFVNVEIRRNAIRLPIEHDGKVYDADSLMGFYAALSPCRGQLPLSRLHWRRPAAR